MKKKLSSLILALTLVLVMTIPAFAGSYSSDGYYEGSYYEIVDTCYSNRYSCSTFCADYVVYTAVVAYSTGELFDRDASAPAMGASTLSKTISNFAISRIQCTHYVDYNVVRTQSVTP